MNTAANPFVNKSTYLVNQEFLVPDLDHPDTICKGIICVDIPAIGGNILRFNNLLVIVVTIRRLLTFFILNFKHSSVVVVTILKLFISFRKSFHPSPPLCLGVLGFGQITCNLPIKAHRDPKPDWWTMVP